MLLNKGIYLFLYPFLLHIYKQSHLSQFFFYMVLHNIHKQAH